MKSWILTDEAARKMAMAGLMETPCDGQHKMEIKKTAKRRAAQNNLGWAWYTHIGKEQGDAPETVHRECKLNFGVPILLRDNDEFAKAWEIVRPHSYEDKMELMRYIDVTSIMGVKQMAEYLQTIEDEYGANGIPLPKKDDEYWLALGYRRVT